MIVQAIECMIHQQVKIVASGRTDKGVHAKGQVFHFDCLLDIMPYNMMKGINSYLPKDIRILKVEKVNEDFHARFSAIKKEYRYYIRRDNYDVFSRNYAVFIPNIEIEKMKEAIKLFEGTHQFQGFCSAEVDKRKNFIKTIYRTDVRIYPKYYEFIFEGTGFLKYQIRRMMGLLIEIGLGKESKEKILEILESHDPKMSHKIADACGLYLYKVTYGDEDE